MFIKEIVAFGISNVNLILSQVSSISTMIVSKFIILKLIIIWNSDLCNKCCHGHTLLAAC